jgi:hypothetical protein
MIAYDILVQTIADWRAGVRPTAPSLPPIPTGAPEVVEEYDSGMVDIDDGQYADTEYAVEEEGGYGEGDDAQAQPADAADQTYRDDEDQY